MDQHYDELLTTTYPEIFSGRHGQPTETLMCFGFECGNGWYPLLNALCAEIMSPARQARAELARCQRRVAEARTEAAADLAAAEAKLAEAVAAVPVAVQVKEKFGTLRFYTNGHDERVDALIDLADRLSATTCESCGMTMGAMPYSLGWIRTLCQQHADEVYGDKAAAYRAARAAEITSAPE